MRTQAKPSESIASIGTLVRDARKLKNISQTALAQKTNLNQKTISALENGAEGTEIRTVLLVFKELGLRIDIGAIGSQEPIYSSEDGKMKAIKKYFVGPDREETLASLRRASGQLKDAGVSSLVLFGSTARGEAGPNSDIDLGYEISGKPGILAVGKVEGILQDLFVHKVDLVSLKDLRGDIRKKAEGEMIRVI